MNLKFKNFRISSITLIVPKKCVKFLDEINNYSYSYSRSVKLAEVMGYDQRRLVEGSVCSSDLLVEGFNFLFDNQLVEKCDIDGLIVVTQTPDFLLPGTSSVVHGKLKFKRDIFCLDISQGCSGFLVGIFQAFMMLEQESIRKVALCNVDVLSRKTCPRDRNSFPLIGDAGSITIIEKMEGGGNIYGSIMTDGSLFDALIIPAGGLRLPSDSRTKEEKDCGDGNFRSLDHLTMQGDKVFNFVMVEVPPMINSVLKYAGLNKDQVDFFLLHQPNRFMIHKVADKLGICHDKVPSNVVEKLGNSSGVTIPAAISLNLKEKITKEKVKVCIAGFGVGLTWASVVMDLGPFDFCKMIEI